MRRLGTCLAVVAALAVGATLAGTGCSYDYGALGPKAGAAGGTGGAASASGGKAGGTGGTTGSSNGGAGTGGRAATGGAQPGTGGAAVSGTGGAPTASMEPALWYKFDEESGMVAVDSGTAPGAPRNGTLTTVGTGGSVSFSTTKQVGTHALSLTGNMSTGGGYVALPPLADVAPGAVTLSAWVYPTVSHDWQRVFDFGSSPTVNMFLTTSEGQDANNYVRFAITTGGNTAEERINTTVAVALNTWTHLVVVLNAGSPYTGSLYVNGAVAGTNTAMTLHGSDLGATTGNYLGRSTFTADWYYSGFLDDFRIYARALTPAEVTAVYIER